MTNFTWEDLESFCNDLSNWIVELDLVEEIQKAHPVSPFPLKPNREADDLDDGLDLLLYLTLWMCLKANTKAPAYLESRIIMVPKTKGPWKEMYAKLCAKINKKENIDEIWNLAG